MQSFKKTFKEVELMLSQSLFYFYFYLSVISVISTALEKLMITNDLEKNGKTTEISSLFKPKIFCAIDRIKEKKKHPDIDSIYDYLSRMEASNIDKIYLELILNKLVKKNIVVNKMTSLGDSFLRKNTPQNLVNPLHTLHHVPIMN